MNSLSNPLLTPILAALDASAILKAGLVMAGLGLVFGLLLAYAARVFSVKTDPRVAAIRGALPSANCGACGHTNCDLFAADVAAGKAPVDGCVPGGAAVAARIAEIMHQEGAENKEPFIAVVHCNGNLTETFSKYRYSGIKTCLAAAQIFHGPKSCNYGCLGFGDCIKACPFNAIKLNNGIAYIDPLACRGCKNCVAACPKNLIFMQPKSKRFAVHCRNPRPGAECREVCGVACIGCQICVKTCPKKAIYMQDSAAVIDPFACVNCGACARACPTHAIREQLELKKPKVMRA